jgi:hypothetical protein
MANFATNNTLVGTQQNMSSTYKTLVSVYNPASGTLRRIKVYDLLVGTNGTPADNFIEWDVSRSTTAGTGTSATPLPLDPADAASLSLSLANITVEPTVTAASDVFYVGVNQRASYRWVAAPGSELVAPAVATNGFVLRAKSSGYTGTATGHIYFQEQ